MAYKYPICDLFHWFCKIARFFATEPKMITKAVGERYSLKRRSDVTDFIESLFLETEYPLNEVVLGGIEAI